MRIHAVKKIMRNFTFSGKKLKTKKKKKKNFTFSGNEKKRKHDQHFLIRK